MVYIHILNLYVAYCCVFSFILFYIMVLYFYVFITLDKYARDLKKVEHELLHNKKNHNI